MPDNEHRAKLDLRAADRAREVARGELADAQRAFLEEASPEEVRVMTSVLRDWDGLNAGLGHEVALYNAFSFCLAGEASRLLAVPADRWLDVQAYVNWNPGDDGATATA